MTFPTFEPSSRTYEHGEFPVSRHKFMTGRSQQLLHANKKSNQRLRLTYDNRPLKDFDYFLEHFNAQRGTHGSFPLTPNVLFAGWNNKKGDAARMGYDQRWRYTKEPRIRSRRGKYGSMEIELQTTENVLSYPTHDSNGNPLGCDPCATPIPSTTTTAITPRSGDNGGECPPLPPVIYPPAPPVNPPGPGGTDPGFEPDDDPNGPDSPTPTPSPGPGDPGLNDPEPNDPEPQPTPEGDYPVPDPPGSEGQLKTYQIWYSRIWYLANYRVCYTGYLIAAGDGWRDMGEEYYFVEATSLSLKIQEGKHHYICGEGETITEWILSLSGTADEGMESERELEIQLDNFIEFYSEGTYHEKPNRRTIRLNRISIDNVEQPLPVPVSEPEPQPVPLKVPNPGNSTSPNFPTHNPSRRRITYGDYEVDRFGQAQEVTMPLPSTAQKTDLVMQLVYANQPDSVARSFMDHYDEVYGNFAEFSIPAGTAKNGTFAGWTSNKSVSKGKWLYARPPQIVTTHPGYSSTTIQLINIEPAPADKDNLLPIGLCPTDPS